MMSVNGIVPNITTFPDQTSQVWKLPETLLNRETLEISWKFESERELIHLAQLKQLLDLTVSKITLVIEYLPYARQDKEVSNDATFALRTFAKFLNALNFNQVTIRDPHSQIALDLINHSKAVYPSWNLLKIIEETKTDILCYPDKGAVSKYTKIQDKPFSNFPYIFGEKVRDQASGRITSYKVIGSPKDKTVLIVDDICDGGMTFRILAKSLLELGAKKVNLFVSHGIFSQGLKVLTDSGIDKVFTVDGEIGEFQQNIFYRRL